MDGRRPDHRARSSRHRIAVLRPRQMVRAACFVAAAMVALFAPPATALAQTACPAAKLAGRYTLDAARSDAVEAAIEAATARMNFLTRRIARRRLKATNGVPAVIEIAFVADTVAVSFDGRAPVVAPVSGAAVAWTREDGETFAVSARFDGGALRQTFVAGDGVREDVYTLEPGGDTLRLHVTVSSDRLPAPVVYTLVYRRDVVGAAVPLRSIHVGIPSPA
ncbi:MAG TPA: hypothetical protein VF158_06615 [Longimicrobiales bacterium]